MNKTIYIILILFSLFGMQTQAQTESQTKENSFLVVPLRIEGIGLLIGVAYRRQAEQKEILVGAAGAENNQRGAGLYYKSNLSDDSFLFGTLFQGKELKIPSTYTRGTGSAQTYHTQIDISAFSGGMGFNFDLSNSNNLKLNLSFGFLTQQFNSFLDENFEDVSGLNDIYIGDLALTNLNFNFVYSYQQNPEGVFTERGFKIYSQLKNQLQTSNTFYSGTAKIDFNLDFHIPIVDSLSLVSRSFYSRSSVTQAKLTDEEKIRELFAINCVNSQEAQNCDDLVDKLVTNLAAHNEYGTATPLGGTDYLRNYSILRYKGSTSEYYAVELRYPFYVKKLLMEPLLFTEQGRAFDPNSTVAQKNFINVVGFEYRFHLSEDLSYKILAAKSAEKQTYQLAIDSSW